MTGRVPAEISTSLEPCVLLKVGEIVLKGGNRQHFERLLQANIRRALRELGLGSGSGTATASSCSGWPTATGQATRPGRRGGHGPDRRAGPRS